MRPSPAALAAVALLAAAGAAGAQPRDSAAFLVRIGTDTSVVERYVRDGSRIVMEAVQRSPSTVLHRMVMTLGAGDRVTEAEWTATPPGAAQPGTRRVVRFRGDSAVVATTQGGGTREVRVAAAAAIPMAGPFYAPYELAIMRAVAGGRPKTEVVLLPAAAPVTIPIERVGRDSVALENQFGEPMRAHVDARGRLLHLHTPAFTTVERLPWIDLDAFARDFAERDATGRGLGMLSPRATTRTMLGGANLWLDYSRPAMRGRPVWGRLVPYGELWRLGANDATHLATDRPLDLGGLALAPGTYTLFLLPAADAWTLVVNRGTGISGLERDSTLDVGRVPMRLETLSSPAEQLTIEAAPAQGGPAQGGEAAGTLSIAWDRTRGSVPIRVR